MSYPIISADSHVTEPPNAYIDNIDPAYRDRAPHLEHMEGAGDMFVIEGLTTSATGTGCPRGRRSRSCPRSTSRRASTRPSRTTGSPSAASA